MKAVVSIDEVRQAGKEFCVTKGSKHYNGDPVDPVEQAITEGSIEDFAINNIRKYATRFRKTHNLNDLRKVSDYAHILCGVELMKLGKFNPEAPTTISASDLTTLKQGRG